MRLRRRERHRRLELEVENVLKRLDPVLRVELDALGAYKPCNVACNKHSPCYKLRGLVTSYLVTLTSHITSTGLQAPDYKGGLQPLVTPLLAVS
jgi:hypothetical protein